jgi:hypothetical protein
MVLESEIKLPWPLFSLLNSRWGYVMINKLEKFNNEQLSTLEKDVVDFGISEVEGGDDNRAEIIRYGFGAKDCQCNRTKFVG